MYNLWMLVLTRHNRRSIRLKDYDYTSPGSYFVTIDTYQHEYTFGRIVSGNMDLSDLGKIAEKCLVEIPGHFPQSFIETYVVMPNHVHAIITILDGQLRGGASENTTSMGANTDTSASPSTDSLTVTSAGTSKGTGTATTPSMGTIYRAHTGEPFTSGVRTEVSKTEKFGKPVPGSLPTIVRTYKAAVSRIATKELGLSNIWHRGYYEHVIRNQEAMQAIAAYILANPDNWTGEPRFIPSLRRQL